MLGLVAATIMAFCKMELSTIALFFIGLQLFDISLHLGYFHMVDKKKANAMKSFFEGLGKGLADGRRNEADCERDKGADGE